jgi:hypothetical protein
MQTAPFRIPCPPSVMIPPSPLRESGIFQQFLLICLLTSFAASAVGQTTLYSTDFESPFVLGTKALTGTDGWVVAANALTAPASAADQPVYGVDKQLVEVGLGQFAFIGSETPLNTSSLYSTYRLTPVTSFALNPLVRFTATLGFTKSFDVPDKPGEPGIKYASLGRNDTFRIAFYNNGFNNNGLPSRKVMASIEWPTYTTTTAASGSIYRGDSSTDSQGKANAFTTDVDIIYGQAQQLNVLINFQTNRWSATLGGSPLFIDAVFRNPINASTIPLTGFGMVAAQWAITPYYSPLDLNRTNPFYDHPGNNWMLFDDWTIASEPLGQMNVSKIERLSNNARLTWATELGYSYRVEYSTNLSTWLKNLPSSLITPIQSSSNQTFTDPNVISGNRYYRVRRAVTGTSGL